ncbi:MAG: MFS transporter [Verrucomicrobiia bacterium]
MSRTVWALGFTSLLTDVSSEMVASILPVYLVLYLGISPLAFGVVDGLYQGAAALVRIAGGVLADRWRLHKAVAVLGYGLSAACRLLIFVAGGAWGMIAAIITLDRIGKGIRTAPRDALISATSPKPGLATAFGVHRALDAVGAMLGPVLAFVLLAMMPRAFDVLFVASFGVALLGLGVITLFVPAVTSDEKNDSPPPVRLQTDLEHCFKCRHCGHGPAPTPVTLRTALQLLGDARFRPLILTAVVLGLASISDGFIFLVLQRRLDVGIAAFPLLYVGTSLFTSVFAIPCGRLADRVGRTRVLLGGYGVLSLVYLILLLPAAGGLYQIAAVLFLLGVFYAATDGVLTAMAAAALPISHAGSGLAVLATASDLSRLAASVLYGFLWSRTSINQATGYYLLALAMAIIAASLFLNRSKLHAT